ncbi:phosphatidylinositol transfer protein Csr1p [[Candida] jaroonii]|uniref:Phosphatidylinositol transfer protein Csr1p n=1 Tax=[Candida] jaroonii TaxID=467808 RepID=A0ACA9YFM4_9ASCO|nr:phosphatidylinositol transfer protein Csr1p [[Candida] jaroonii]
MSIQYRPGRIQSINADQEIILKQFYACLLKYFGYEIDISVEDIVYKECFISSTRTTELSESGYSSLNYGLVRTGTRDSTTSSHISHKTSASSYSTLNKKKKAGILKRGKKSSNVEEELHAPESSPRMKFIQSQSSFEKYQPIDINPRYAHVFCNYYKQNFDNSEEYMSDNEDSGDVESIESFVTAETYVETPDYSQFKSGKATSSSSSFETESFNVKPITDKFPEIGNFDNRKLHKALCDAPRNDAFDNFILRFVRARKFKTKDALAMIGKSAEWRVSTFKPDEWVREGDALSYVTGKNPGFIKNFTTQKSYVRGVDKDSNPIFFFKAKLHLISDAPLADTQRFAVYTIESCRLFLRDINESVDTCSIVFDLTGFSLKNADYNAIKFLAEVFEAHYPECLGKVLIFNAPWIFSTVWNVIKNWLDPVVASKIHFTKDFKELNKFIDKKWIPDYMGGDDTYAGEYPVPSERDATYMKPRDGEFVRLMRERDALLLKMLTTTKKWVESTSPEISDRYLQDKLDLNAEMANNYIKLDPYLRFAGFYDRNGSLTVRC